METKNTLTALEYLNGKETGFYQSAWENYYSYSSEDISCHDMLLVDGGHIYLFSGLNNANDEFEKWCKTLSVINNSSVLETAEQVKELERFILCLKD